MQESEKNLELQGEISKVVKVYELKFDCPHCHEEINESHFGEREKAFQLIKEKVRKIAEEELSFQKVSYKEQWLKQIEENKFYEKFQGVIEKMKTIENLTKAYEKLKEEKTEIELKLRQDLAKATSYDEIRKLDGVRELEKKIGAYQKEIEELKIGNQPEIQKLNQTIKELEENIAKERLEAERAKSSEEVEKLDRVRGLKKEIEEKNKKIEELNIENQPKIKELRENVKNLEKEKADAKINFEKMLGRVTSADAISELKVFKELKEECDRYKKENREKEEKLSELKSSEYIEKLERVRKLSEENNELRNQNQILRDQGRMSKKKGENFEQYVLEELSRVFDNKDKISKITQKGEKADFLQEVLTENGEQVAGRIIYEAKNEKNWKNEWVNKLENDMANEKADFGIIIAICENGKPLRCLDPRKKIYVSNDENFVYIAKIMRDSLIQKHNYLKKGDTDEDSKEKRIKNFEEWISSKFPQYLSRLENELTNLKKNSYHADKITEITRNAEVNIRKIILEEVRIELSNLAT